MPRARIPIVKVYQVPCATRIRAEADVVTGAVGLITQARHADEIIKSGDADLVLIGREMLREPYWAVKAQQEQGEEPAWPIRYGYAIKRRNK
jgi:2,4-dienoyl-CoA reductase-like NADH-dependent reductase (Old Yellow Enzyme family)